MAASASIAKVSLQHEALMDLMLQNPFATLKQLSELTGYTVPWISVITNSDAFKCELKRRRGDIEEDVSNDITAHLRATAITTLSKTMELVEKSTDLEAVSKTNTEILQALGFGPKGSVNIINNTQQNTSNQMLVGNIPAAVFNEARQNFGRSIPSSSVPPEPLVSNGEDQLLLEAEVVEVKQQQEEVTKD